jgi:hypothetical protein
MIEKMYSGFKILRFKNFIDQETCDKINAWVDEGVEKKWLDKGVSRGSGWEYDKRYTTRGYPDRFEYTPILYEVYDKITNFLELENTPKSVHGGGKNGLVISCTFPGGDVYKHIDPMENILMIPPLHVLRCNILTRKADVGAELYINDQHVDIEVGELHCYLPSSVEHYVTEAQGNTSRVMCMFGYQMSEPDFENLYANRFALSKKKLITNNVFFQGSMPMNLSELNDIPSEIVEKLRSVY